MRYTIKTLVIIASIVIFALPKLELSLSKLTIADSLLNENIEKNSNYINIKFIHDTIPCFSKKVAVMWCPTEQELNHIISQYYPPEEEMDDAYYNTIASDYLPKDVQYYILTNSSLGFILDSDTIILNKKQYSAKKIVGTDDFSIEREGFLWKMVLFNGVKKPLVIPPVEMYKYANFWN